MTEIDNPTDANFEALYRLVALIGGATAPDLRIQDGASLKQVVSSIEYIGHHRDALHNWIKQIDRDPSPGAHLITGQRAAVFTCLHTKHFFYEPLSGYDAILRVMRMWPLIDDGSRAAADSLDGVQVSFHLFAGAYTAPQGRIPMPAPGEAPVDVHAVQIVGWQADGGELLFRNSWGTGWGDRGYGVLTREYLERYLEDAFLVRRGWQGLTPAKARLIDSSARHVDFSRIWRAAGGATEEIFVYDHCRLRMIRTPTWSLEHQAWSDVIQLRDPFGFRLGWAMVTHPAQAPSLITEIFVWPPFRRRGYGRLLETQAADAARRRGADRVDLYLHVADALVGPVRDAAHRFGLALGYSWNWTAGKLPNLAAIGRKSLMPSTLIRLW
jgi:GNAT superfamily N-acetyltransferase